MCKPPGFLLLLNTALVSHQQAWFFVLICTKRTFFNCLFSNTTPIAQVIFRSPREPASKLGMCCCGKERSYSKAQWWGDLPFSTPRDPAELCTLVLVGGQGCKESFWFFFIQDWRKAEFSWKAINSVAFCVWLYHSKQFPWVGKLASRDCKGVAILAVPTKEWIPQLPELRGFLFFFKKIFQILFLFETSWQGLCCLSCSSSPSQFIYLFYFKTHSYLG